MKGIIAWMQAAAVTPTATYLLVFISFADSSFFPVPPDFLLIPMCALNPSASFSLAALTTGASVIGAIVGFFIGKRGGEPLCRRWFGQEKWQKAEQIFSQYQTLSVAIAALSPIPYKIMTIGTGALGGDLKGLVLISLIFRGFRFFAEAALIFYFGAQMQAWIEQRFDWITIMITALLVVFFFLYRWKIRKPKLEAE